MQNLLTNLITYRVEEQTLDASNSNVFKKNLLAQVEAHPNLILDLGRTDFIDSSALGAILSGLKRAQQLGGLLAICSLTGPVRVLFELVRMHRIVDIFNDEEEALRAIKGS